MIGSSKEHDAEHVVDLYTALAAATGARNNIKENLDYPTGPAFNLLGFDTLMFTPLFVASRVTGWTAHIVEQRAANALIRPLAAYDGSAERQVPTLAVA